jgi:hypothetical protein
LDRGLEKSFPLPFKEKNIMEYEITTDKRFNGIRKVGIFSETDCIGYAVINIYDPDAFDYAKCKEKGLKVLVV